jgi:Clostripain family
MNMIEIAYELRSLTKMMVGSQEVEPGDGWPYDKVLAALAAKPDMTPEQLGRQIVEKYAASYGTENVTQSLLATGRAEDAGAAVDALARALLPAMKKPAEYAAVTKAVRAAQHYDVADFVDLCDFCEQVRRRTTVAKLKTACADTIAAVRDAKHGLVRAERHKGTAVAGSRGVSIYFPRGDATVAYDRLAFAKQTHWNEFLAVL